jgi:hypothetical protein
MRTRRENTEEGWQNNNEEAQNNAGSEQLLAAILHLGVLFCQSSVADGGLPRRRLLQAEAAMGNR